MTADGGEASRTMAELRRTKPLRSTNGDNVQSDLGQTMCILIIDYSVFILDYFTILFISILLFKFFLLMG